MVDYLVIIFIFKKYTLGLQKFIVSIYYYINMSEVTIENNLIYLDESIIGYIEYSPNYRIFKNIEIEEEYRGEGYGKKAFNIWFNKARKNTNKIECTAVVSNRMEKILRNFDFEINENDKYVWKKDKV